ncbi:MAG: undecaprenyl-diphosphatase, partial [Parvularculaceae bacterium]|nr:undecaprenyl-diphosphatase [Parvularculaceae bacterium]
GARLLGVDRAAAAEFSFFVAIPTMIAAAGYGLYKARDSITTDGLLMVAIGFVSAFLSALLIVRWVIGFISKRGFLPFAYYRIALGALIFVLLAMGLGRPA